MGFVVFEFGCQGNWGKDKKERKKKSYGLWVIVVLEFGKTKNSGKPIRYFGIGSQ